jgi:hypothetical protein
MEEHPRGALALTAIFILLAAVMWFSVYALLLVRG